MPEYDSSVEIEPPTFEFSTPYNNVITVAAPMFNVSSASSAQGVSRHSTPRFASGAIGIPDDYTLAYVDKGETIVRREHAPAVNSFLAANGWLDGYKDMGGAERVNGIPRFQSGALTFFNAIMGTSGQNFSQLQSQMDDRRWQDGFNAMIEKQNAGLAKDFAISRHWSVRPAIGANALSSSLPYYTGTDLKQIYDINTGLQIRYKGWQLFVT